MSQSSPVLDHETSPQEPSPPPPGNTATRILAALLGLLALVGWGVLYTWLAFTASTYYLVIGLLFLPAVVIITVHATVSAILPPGEQLCGHSSQSYGPQPKQPAE